MDKEQAKQKVDEVKEKASHVKDIAKEKASHAKDIAKEKAEIAKEKAAHATEVTKKKAKEFADTASHEIHKITDSPEFKSISNLTWGGLGITVLFGMGTLINAINLNWWIMLPLALAGIYMLHSQWLKEDDKKSNNARICLGALIALALLIIWRDIQMSEALVHIGETATSVADDIKKLLE